jgi:branched-chain amino acid transport system permease protein
MFYREGGEYKTSYQADQAALPLRQDRLALAIVLGLAFAIVPLTASSFALSAVFIPVLIFSLAAVGLNLLTGYAGQISAGTGAFMGVGAYSCYKLTTLLPDCNIIGLILASGLISAAVGAAFSLPALRIKGYYVAIATLAAQFFLSWCFIRIPWLYNHNVSGAIEVPTRTVFGIPLTGPNAAPVTRYLIVLGIVVLLTWIASNLVHGRIGRMWMAVRDMDIAAELIGINLYRTKLLAFAVSSYYCGVAGAMMVFLWLGAAEADSFDVNHSFIILFMVIIGGLGSLLGFLGAAFIWVLPIALRGAPAFFGLKINAATVEHLQFMIVGALIIFFLIVQPYGLARLLQIGKHKMRVWPFPY